jgi:hypothetical protein
LIFCIVLAKNGKVKEIIKNTRLTDATLKICRIRHPGDRIAWVLTKIDPPSAREGESK